MRWNGQNPASAVRALEDLMARCAPGQRPAVIGVNSVTTTYTLHAMREMGLAIPQQIGLCGPEDWELGRPDELARTDSPPAYYGQRARKRNRRHGHAFAFGPHCGPCAGQAGGSFARRAEPARLFFAFPPDSLMFERPRAAGWPCGARRFPVS